MQVSYKVKARLLFVLPGLLFLLTVLGYPLGMLIYNSFFRYNFAGVAGRTYIGFENYQKLFADERFLTTLWNTFVFTFSAITVELILGESAKRAQPPMKIAPYSELLDVITQGLSEALSGGKPVGEALKKVNDQWTEILKNNGYIK